MLRVGKSSGLRTEFFVRQKSKNQQQKIFDDNKIDSLWQRSILFVSFLRNATWQHRRRQAPDAWADGLTHAVQQRAVFFRNAAQQLLKATVQCGKDAFLSLHYTCGPWIKMTASVLVANRTLRFGELNWQKLACFEVSQNRWTTSSLCQLRITQSNLLIVSQLSIGLLAVRIVIFILFWQTG